MSELERRISEAELEGMERALADDGVGSGGVDCDDVSDLLREVRRQQARIAALEAQLAEKDASIVAHFQREHLAGDGPEIDRYKRVNQGLEKALSFWLVSKEGWLPKVGRVWSLAINDEQRQQIQDAIRASRESKEASAPTNG